MPVRDVVEQGLDIMIDNLAQVVKAVQTETGLEEEEEDEAQVPEPQQYQDMNGMNGMNGNGMNGAYGMNGGGMNGDMSYGGYGAPQAGGQGWQGSGMSPLRR